MKKYFVLVFILFAAFCFTFSQESMERELKAGLVGAELSHSGFQFQPVKESNPEFTPAPKSVFYEGFNAWPPAGWDIQQLSTSTDNWNMSAVAYAGAGAAYHHDFNASHDSWLISPAIDLEPGRDYVLSFFERNTFVPAYYGYSGVMISTGSSEAGHSDFVEVYESDAPLAAYTQKVIDISAYAGQKIYVAFVYQGVYAHRWWVDEFTISEVLQDDFAVVSVDANFLNYIGDEVLLSADIMNNGETAQSKTVTFKANDIFLAEVDTVVLEQYETETVTFLWEPAAPAFYTVTAEVPDDENNNNNQADTLIAVVTPQHLAEDFEGDFLPLGWEETGIAKQWFLSNAAHLLIHGDWSAVIAQVIGDPEEMLMTRPFNVDHAKGWNTVYYWTSGLNNTFEYGSTTLQIKYREMSKDTWTDLGVPIDYAVAGDGIRLQEIDLSALPEGVYQVAFATVSTFDYAGYASGIVLDDVVGPPLYFPDFPIFSINPAAHDFGLVEVGVPSPPRNFTITNTGGGTLEVFPPVLNDVKDGVFALDYEEGVFPASLEAEETVVFTVTFTPDAVDEFEASVMVNYNDGDDNEVQIDLSGEGFVRPAGSTCANPYFFTLPVEDYMDNTEQYGNDYSRLMVDPESWYLNGHDFVGQFTLDSPGFLSGSVAGTWTGVHILQECPNMDSPAPVLVRAAGSTGGAFTALAVEPGTYFAIVSTWPAPDFTDFTLNLSFIPQYSVNIDVDPEGITGMANPLGAGLYVTNEEVTISVEDVDGFAFVEWVGDFVYLLNDPSEMEQTFDMPDYDVSFTAYYEELPSYAVELFHYPEDIDVILTGDGEYKEGEEVTITAALAKGHDFSHWEGEHLDLIAGQENEPVAVFDMPGHPVAFTAVFEPWEPEPFNVEIFVVPQQISVAADPQGAGEHLSTSDVTISVNEVDGYLFIGWEGNTYLLDDASKLSQTFTMPWYDVEFTAVYAILQPSAIISIEQFPLKGIWEWKYVEGLTTWKNLMQGVTANKILVADIKGDGGLEIIMDIADVGLGFFCLTQNAWNYLASDPVDFTILRPAEGPRKLVASFADGIRQWNFASKSWSYITLNSARLLHAIDYTRDGMEELAIAFNAIDGLYTYSFETESFTRRSFAKVEQLNSGDITGDGHKELIIVYEGLGIYMLRQVEDAKLLTDVNYMNIPEIDIRRDKLQTGKWYADSKGLQVYRITWAVPMEGHLIATGDITAGDAEELIFSWNDRLIAYSYTGKGFATIVQSPMKRVISGRFTGEDKDDLIVCHTYTGNIFLYNNATQSFQIIEKGGDSNAMAPLH